MATTQVMMAMATRVEATAGGGEGGLETSGEEAIGAARLRLFPEDIRDLTCQPTGAITSGEVSEVATVTPDTLEVVEGTGECLSNENRLAKCNSELR